jgi:hypothetical protein
MAKLSPTEVEGNKRLEGSRVKEFADVLRKKTASDDTDRAPWISDLARCYDRRYAASVFDKPQVNYPWPGASNIAIGLSDTHIEELKPSFMNLHFGGPRTYQMHPRDASSVENVGASNLTMDDIVKYRMPDYMLQSAWGIDSLGTFGLKTDKVFYDYATRQTMETIRRADLPPRLASFAVVSDVSDFERQFAQQMGMTLMTREEFDKVAREVESVVRDEYDLDPEDRIDAVTIREIMQYLRNGSRDARLVVKRRAVVRDTPRLITIPQEDLVVPQGTTDIRLADRICHWMWFTEAEMLQRARDDVWGDTATQAVLGSGPEKLLYGTPEGSDAEMRQLKLSRNQTTEPMDEDGGLFRIGEYYAHWDIDGDGLAERVVITMDPKSGVVLKAMQLPFDHGEWPFIDTFLEATDQDRHSSRGIPKQIAEYERHATALARAELNNLVIETSRSFTYLDTGSVNPSEIEWMPNLMIPVASHDDLRAIEMAPRALALEAPLRAQLSLAERRVSGSNRAVLDLPPPERRTKAEIDTFNAASNRIRGVRAMLYMDGMRQAGRQIWALWRQWGPDKFYAMATGQSPRKLTQAQIAGDFFVTPVAAVGDMDPEFRSQRNLTRIQMAMQMHPLVANDPRWLHDLAQIYADWMNETDPIGAQRYLRARDQQAQQEFIQQQQGQAQRASQIHDIALRVAENAGVSPQEASIVMREFRSASPHKGLAAIMQGAQQAMDSARMSGELLGANGRPS